MVNLYVANTDNDWFDYLASQPDLPEVNFWRPSPQNFHAIGSGELFVFRLRSPRGRIGGFGVLSDASVLPLQVAWEAFGSSNGAPTYDRFRAKIAQLRPQEVVGPATVIGCRILVQPVFFASDDWLELPESWSNHIQGGKRYSADEEDGRRLWDKLQDLAQAESMWQPSNSEIAESGARYGTPTLITPRLGQGAFRIAVTEAYGRQCALTSGRVLPALDAAHIRPYGEGGVHAKSNGVLLRKDIHSVFDAGYATIDTDYRFVVSAKVKDVFDNGEEYRKLHGATLRLPRNPADHPNREFLAWHNEKRFLG